MSRIRFVRLGMVCAVSVVRGSQGVRVKIMNKYKVKNIGDLYCGNRLGILSKIHLQTIFAVTLGTTNIGRAADV